MSVTTRTARFSVVPDDPTSPMSTEVTAFLIEDGGKPIGTSWEATSSGDIGRGILDGETRTWFFIPTNDQSGEIDFGISGKVDPPGVMSAMFSLDVSDALQARQISVADHFPFVPNMQGRGAIQGQGGQFPAGMSVQYVVFEVKAG